MEKEGLWRWEVGGGRWGRCVGDGGGEDGIEIFFFFFVHVFFNVFFFWHTLHIIEYNNQSHSYHNSIFNRCFEGLDSKG